MSDIFDKEALLDSIDGDVEFLKETIEMLDEDCPELLEQAQAAAQAGDAETLVKPAHAIKGMLANFYAVRAVEAARSLELMGRENQLDGATVAVESLEKEVTQLKIALNEFLKEQQA